MKKAIIIGAGPAGLTAALELLRSTDILPIVFETDSQPGGISKTISVKGFRMDIGGHRFFSKSDKVMKWWSEILPPAGAPARDDRALNRDIPLFPGGPDPEKTDAVMLVRKRLSRILFERKFYPYPLSLSPTVFSNLGLSRTARAGFDYLLSSLIPRKPEKNLEDFLINRFGKTLYELFFKDYTYKVWGKSCKEIDASWGKQRIKGLSLKKILITALKLPFERSGDVHQKNRETSLINYFLYPKFGPGQLWEEVSRIITEHGGKIYFNSQVEKVVWENNKVLGVIVRNTQSQERKKVKADFILSSSPLRNLLLNFTPPIPPEVAEVAEGLPYRDFITVGIHLEKVNIPRLDDNWIYVQEPDVKVGRLQIFNNWSPYLVPEEKGLWIGMEFFANEDDELWSLSEVEISKLAVLELKKLGIIKDESFADFTHVHKEKKAYPAYWGSYDRFHIVKEFLNRFENLFTIGRNGMHRYNNQDHSMLSAMEAVKNILNNNLDKENIWAINAEDEYHEEGKLHQMES